MWNYMCILWFINWSGLTESYETYFFVKNCRWQNWPSVKTRFLWISFFKFMNQVGWGVIRCIKYAYNAAGKFRNKSNLTWNITSSKGLKNLLSLRFTPIWTSFITDKATGVCWSVVSFVKIGRRTCCVLQTLCTLTPTFTFWFGRNSITVGCTQFAWGFVIWVSIGVETPVPSF